MSIALSPGWSRRVGSGAAAVLLVAALVLIGYNETRPLYGPRSIFFTERADQYFTTRPFGADYRAAIGYLNTQPRRHIGLVLGANAWEYPFWSLLEGEDGGIPRLEHVLVGNLSGRLATQRQQPADIICVSCTGGAARARRERLPGATPLRDRDRARAGAGSWAALTPGPLPRGEGARQRQVGSRGPQGWLRLDRRGRRWR